MLSSVELFICTYLSASLAIDFYENGDLNDSLLKSDKVWAPGTSVWIALFIAFEGNHGCAYLPIWFFHVFLHSNEPIIFFF